MIPQYKWVSQDGGQNLPTELRWSCCPSSPEYSMHEENTQSVSTARSKPREKLDPEYLWDGQQKRVPEARLVVADTLGIVE